MDQDLIPSDEKQRLDAVRRYDILDTPRDGAFDRITALAAKFFDVPICIVSIVDHDRIWFKSHHGIDVQEIDREPGLCASAILDEKAWVVTDAKIDPRTLTNPLVCGDLGLRFYAGVPLKTSDGYKLGTLNIIDLEPRTITQQELKTLEDLASLVVDELELRLAARRLVATVTASRRHGVEMTDNVIQDLVVAKLALDLGDSDKALRALESALAAASSIATDLLASDEALGIAPGDLVRQESAGIDRDRA